MMGLGRLGKLGAVGRAIASLQSQLWPLGAASPGMWIAPRYVDDSFQDSAGTTALSAIGTVLDTSNPIGLILDRKAGATTLADPGIHLSQSTSAARPVASARVNLLTYSEDFSNGVWSTINATLTPDFAEDPFGGNTAAKVVSTASNGLLIYILPTLSNNTDYTLSIYVKTATAGAASVLAFYTDSGGTTIGSTAFTTTGAWQRVTVSANSGALSLASWLAIGGASTFSTGEDVLVACAQVNSSLTPLPYQRVNTASDYDATGFPVATKFDGVDDSWSSATFTANTVLTSGMTALIAVRRDSAAACVAGLYNAVADATKWFGMAESGSGSGCVGSGAGTPTVWVDGVQLTGGTAVTRDTLNTALTPGTVHILEFRDLDLSTWTAAKYGLYTGYVLNGAFLGDGIMLFPSTTDAIRDRARTALAASVGVTL